MSALFELKKILIATIMIISMQMVAYSNDFSDYAKSVENSLIEKDKNLKKSTNEICKILGASACKEIQSSSCLGTPAINFCTQKIVLEIISATERCGSNAETSDCMKQESNALNMILSITKNLNPNRDSNSAIAFLVCEPLHHFTSANKIWKNISETLEEHFPGSAPVYNNRELVECIKDRKEKMLTR